MKPNKKLLIGAGIVLALIVAYLLWRRFGGKAAQKEVGEADGGNTGEDDKHNDRQWLGSFLENPEAMASKDQPGSWKGMDPELLDRLAALSREVGHKLKLNSGYRSPEHNKAVGGVSDSAHVRRKAVDISAGNSTNALAMAKAAAKVGFKRIGVGKTFVHVDTDYSKSYPTAWGKEYYSNSPFSHGQLMRELNL